MTKIDGRTAEGRDLRDERKARAWALRQDGWRIDQIAAEIGVGASSASMMCFEARHEANRAAERERYEQMVAPYRQALGSWWIGGAGGRGYRPVWMIQRFTRETNQWTGFPWWVAHCLRLDSHSKSEPRGTIVKKGFHTFDGFAPGQWATYRQIPGLRGLPEGWS